MAVAAGAGQRRWHGGGGSGGGGSLIFTSQGFVLFLAVLFFMNWRGGASAQTGVVHAWVGQILLNSNILRVFSYRS